MLADVPGWPNWTPSVEAARSNSGAGVGARFALKQPLQKEAIWIVTEWQSGRSFAWEWTKNRRRYFARHELVESGAETISLAGLRLEGVGMVTSTIMRPILAAAVAAENRALKTQCEMLRLCKGHDVPRPDGYAAQILQRDRGERKVHGTTH